MVKTSFRVGRVGSNMKRLSAHYPAISRISLFLSVVGIILGSSALCACSSPSTPDASELQQMYRNAVKDAETAEPNEISTNLTAIVPYNDKLTWQSETGRVLVVTWTSWSGYDGLVGNTTVLQREVWVTAAPELQNFCKNCCRDNESLTLRLEQLQGLPPDNGKTRIVEMWVSPADLFRPSPDPEISDREAGIDFPIPSDYITVNQSYIEWFNTLKNASYGENGYPWTRLGYTYDWGNPQGEVGLSEFVVRQGAIVGIYSVSSTEAYCK
jgi:hypothetical protein